MRLEKDKYVNEQARRDGNDKVEESMVPCLALAGLRLKLALRAHPHYIFAVSRKRYYETDLT